MESDNVRDSSGMRVQAGIFLGIAAFLVVAAIVYGITAAEEAGTTMLLLAGGMALIVGSYLGVQLHSGTDPAEPDLAAQEPAAEEPAAQGEAYLPHASVWPFAMGMGMVVTANGLALGGWALVPGLLLTAASVWGYARQSRRRD